MKLNSFRVWEMRDTVSNLRPVIWKRLFVAVAASGASVAHRPPASALGLVE